MKEPVCLGLVDGISDAGAALFVGRRLVAAVNEERLTRVKLQGGFPVQSLAAVLELAGLSLEAVEEVAVAGIATPHLPTRICRGLQTRLAPTAGVVYDPQPTLLARLADLARYRLRLTTNRPESLLGRIEGRVARWWLRRLLPPTARLHLVDHHEAHAAAAFFSAPVARALVVTADSLGDGASLCAWRGEGRRLVRLCRYGPFVSFGTFYALVTRFLGFRPYRHEGKVTALAAHGEAARVRVPFPLRWEGDRLRYDGAWGLQAWAWLERLRPYRPEDVAAWLQAGTEEGIATFVSRWVRRTGLRDVCLGGGVFANVQLNRQLLEVAGLERLFVYPHMGDGGLAVGAVLARLRPEGWRLPPLFLGPTVDERAAAEVLAGVPHERPADPEAAAAALLARGWIVGRCAGPLEYGPRALGNRSVLAPADPDMPARLNRRLARTVFMPFAPVVLAEAAAERLDLLARAPEAGRHMTLAFPARPKLREEAPGAVHRDGTARAQVATRTEFPALHRLLALYRERTGRASLINTSLNRHEEPLVATAAQALALLRAGALDALLLGPFLVWGKKKP